MVSSATTPNATTNGNTSANNSTYIQTASSILKPPKTPQRYSRDRSNHSMSVVYSSSSNNKHNNNNSSNNNNNNNDLSHGHLSRRSTSTHNNNHNSNNHNNSHNMSMLDSDAQSLPQGTFAIKAGPQTIMSQWVVTLDDGDEDEDDDDGQDADDDQVDVVDDVVSNNNIHTNSVNYKNGNYANVNTGLLANLNAIESVNANTNGGATNYSEEEKWEDAVGTPHDLISSSSNNNRNISNKSPSLIQQQQYQPPFSNSISGLASNLAKSNSKLNSSLNAEEKNYLSNNIEIMAANANYKYINHSMSDDILNYDLIYKNSSTNNNHNREMNFSPQANRYSQNSYNFYSQASKELRFS
jgi:hypothetical protein